MQLAFSLVFYLLVGLGSGWVQRKQSKPPETQPLLIHMLLFTLFWPLMLTLGQSPEPPKGQTSPETSPETPLQKGPYSEQIEQGLDKTEAAITQLEGTAGKLLSREKEALAKTRQRLLFLDHQIAELDNLLKQSAFDKEAIQEQLERTKEATPARQYESLQVQLQTIEKLQSTKQEHIQELEEILAILTQIHSQLTLLRFTGRQEGINATLEQMLDLIASIHEIPLDHRG